MLSLTGGVGCVVAGGAGLGSLGVGALNTALECTGDREDGTRCVWAAGATAFSATTAGASRAVRNSLSASRLLSGAYRDLYRYGNVYQALATSGVSLSGSGLATASYRDEERSIYAYSVVLR